MQAALEIRGSNTQFEIFHQGKVVAGPYTSHANATAALTGVEQRLNPAHARFRICCRCRNGFMAVGRKVTCGCGTAWGRSREKRT